MSQPNLHAARLSILAAAVAIALQPAFSDGPTYAANVPKKLLMPDAVETERLGTLNFFHVL